MKACAYCRLYFQDGTVCPRCGQYLVPCQPQQQAPLSVQAPAPRARKWPVVVLSILCFLLAAALTAMVVAKAMEPAPVEEQHPTELEQAAADSAWYWYSELYGAMESVATASSRGTDEGVSLDQWGSALQDSMTALSKLMVLGDEAYVRSVDASVHALSGQYPRFVAAWEDMRDANAVTSSSTSSSASSSGSAAMAWGEGSADAMDPADLEPFKKAGEKLKQAASSEGIDTSRWSYSA